MKVFIAELLDVNGDRVRHSDDVNLVVYCGDTIGMIGKVTSSFHYVASKFNLLDKRTAGGSPIGIYPNENWVFTEVGTYEGPHEVATLLTYATGDA